MTEQDAPRDGLIRMNADAIELRDDGTEGRTLVGYAARFNSPTVIDSWEGNFREVIAPGAFARTLKNNGAAMKVLFNHGMDPQIGNKPLGKPAVMREDDKGLYVEVPLSRTSYNDDIIELLRDGALDGMSFRFSVPKGGDTWEHPPRGIPTRTLTEIKMAEFGPVTFPAYKATSAGVRSREEFSIWRSLPDDVQAEVFRLVTDSTRSAAPAKGTAGERSAEQEETEGLGAEGSATTPGSPHSRKRAALLARAELDPEYAAFTLLTPKEETQDG